MATRDLNSRFTRAVGNFEHELGPSREVQNNAAGRILEWRNGEGEMVVRLFAAHGPRPGEIRPLAVQFDPGWLDYASVIECAWISGHHGIPFSDGALMAPSEEGLAESGR